MQNEKSKEYFSVVWRVVASGGGAASFVGGFPKMGSDFVQGVEQTKNRQEGDFSFAPDKKSQQTFEIILPNLIHKSKKRNLH